MRVNHSRGPACGLAQKTFSSPPLPSAQPSPEAAPTTDRLPTVQVRESSDTSSPTGSGLSAKFTLAPQPESEQLATQHKGARRVVTTCRGRASLPSPYCLAPGPPCPGLVQLSMRSALNEQSWVPRSSQVSVSIRKEPGVFRRVPPRGASPGAEQARTAMTHQPSPFCSKAT